jgi:peroxiredoxin
MRKILVALLCTAALFAAETNRRAPGFALPDLKGQMHDLADFRGKPVVLEFMQTTCPHCAAFTTVLSQVAQKYGDRVGIIAVVNPPDDQGKVSAYISGHKITYPILFDCGQMAYSYLQKTSFDLPQVYLIDANGVIRSEFVYDPINHDIFEGNALMPEIEKLLASRAPAGKKK